MGALVILAVIMAGIDSLIVFVAGEVLGFHIPFLLTFCVAFLGSLAVLMFCAGANSGRMDG